MNGKVVADSQYYLWVIFHWDDFWARFQDLERETEIPVVMENVRGGIEPWPQIKNPFINTSSIKGNARRRGPPWSY
jgi:hypothetical protein